MLYRPTVRGTMSDRAIRTYPNTFPTAVGTICMCLILQGMLAEAGGNRTQSGGDTPDQQRTQEDIYRGQHNDLRGAGGTGRPVAARDDLSQNLSQSPTAAMTPVEIRTLWLFESELRRAARDLRLPAPKVFIGRGRTFPFDVSPTTAAFVWPDARENAVVVMPRAVGWRDAQVRCFARHELAHIALGQHGACVLQEGTADQCDPVASARVIAQHHAEVADLMRATWGEDSRCE